MKEVKYIPGDLVMTNGAPIGTKEGVAYVITACDPDRTVTLEKCGTVLKGTVTLDAIEKEDRWHFVPTSTWVKHIVPIKLTPAILEANGWKKEPSENIPWYKYVTDKSCLYICKDSFTNKTWLVCVGLYKYYIANIQYVHQLQHLLFGLGLPMDLKV